MSLEAHIRMGNWPVSVKVETIINIDNFTERMNKLRRLGEDELVRSNEITTFRSKVMPLHRSGIIDGVDDMYLVVAEVKLEREVSDSSVVWCTSNCT